MSTSYAIFLALVIVAVVVVLSFRFRSKKLWQRLSGRASIDIEDAIMERFREGEIDITCAAGLWKSIADCYSIPPDKLRLDDRFSNELNPGRLFAVDDEISSVNLMISRFVDERGLSVDVSTLHTLEDCIRQLCRPVPTR